MILSGFPGPQQGAAARAVQGQGAGAELGIAAPANPTGTFPPRLEVRSHLAACAPMESNLESNLESTLSWVNSPIHLSQGTHCENRKTELCKGAGCQLKPGATWKRAKTTPSISSGALPGLARSQPSPSTFTTNSHHVSTSYPSK